MTLELPPDRRLDRPDQMVETILAEVEVEPGRVPSLVRTRRTRQVLVAVAAAAVGVVAIVGVGVAGRGQHDRVAGPAPSSSDVVPAPAPAPSARTVDGTSPAGRPVVVAVGTPVSFTDVIVTVDQLEWTATQGLLVQAEVCVRQLPPDHNNGDTTPIGWDPWTVNSRKATFVPQVADGSRPPMDLFPHQGVIRIGDCARGRLPFTHAPDSPDISAVSYRDTLGNQAIWVPAGAPSDLHRQVAFPYLTVSVGGIIHVGREYAIDVSTCVTQLPPGTPKTGLPLSREPWRLETDRGEVTIDDPLTDALPLPMTYPQEGRYQLGDCVSGYIPFGISRGATVNAIRYDNLLGDHAVWLPQR